MAKLEKLREIELELLEQFINVCERESLTWYAVCGTLLGAVRENGFLIWDDDIDVAMPTKSYNKLLSHKEWFGEPYFMQTPLDAGRSHTIKLRKNGTTAFEKNLFDTIKCGGHQGICIDVLPLDEIEDSGYYLLQNNTVHKDYFGTPQKIKFEHLEINAPIAYRKVLGMLYGYWNWPSGAETIHPHYWFYDTDCDYSVYINRYTGWLSGSQNKKIYLFGAADSARIWLRDFGQGKNVACMFDNDKNKWETEAFGMTIRNPVEIPKLIDENSRLIVASIWHREIGQQLEEMGITDYFVFLDDLFVSEFKGKQKQ
ncbi:MAG: LicD family protein [Candidatus Accumulibacter sp.]|jgi:phosphorylcholine metabolism protein LicD|nr:LicD family protein [Accumulibacter sp.]